MVRQFRKAFFVVGKQRGKKFFLRKPFPTRGQAEEEIRRARIRAKMKAEEIRASGRKVMPTRLTGVRVIERPRFGFKKRKR